MTRKKDIRAGEEGHLSCYVTSTASSEVWMGQIFAVLLRQQDPANIKLQEQLEINSNMTYI